jgi:hypothetical protein
MVDLGPFPLGQELDLPPAAEEVATFYAALIESDHAQDATFNKNFFEDWRGVLKKHPPVCRPFLDFNPYSRNIAHIARRYQGHDF